jgi:hypothetical protein
MLSEAAINALTTAYGETISLFPDAFGEQGNHPRTIRALVKKGLLEPEDEDDFECEYFITKKGRQALGLSGSAMTKPKRLKTAVRRAIVHWIGDTGLLSENIYPPSQLSAVVWVNDEQQADYSDALMLVDTHGAELGQVDDFVVGAIERMVRDLGFDVAVETSRLFIEFWPGEDD